MKIENKNVKIKIKSQISDLMLSEVYDFEFEDDESHSSHLHDNIEYSTQGILSVDGDNVKISYEENELMGLEGCETSLHFNKVTPDVITIMRTGSLISGFVFDPSDKRQICTYETEFMPLEFCVYTRTVGNNLTYDNGGTLKLDYDIEVHGVRTERNRFTLEVKNFKDGDNSERI